LSQKDQATAGPVGDGYLVRNQDHLYKYFKTIRYPGQVLGDKSSNVCWCWRFSFFRQGNVNLSEV
jgi:hypothetical protein